MILSLNGIIAASKITSTLNTGLYAVYNADNNTNDSFGTLNGTAVGGLTYTTGKIGNAFQFNGTNAQIDFGNTAFNFGSDSLSISMWFYPNAGNVLQCLVNKGLLTATEKGFNVLIDNRYNSNQRGISFAIGGGSGNYQQFSTTNQYTIGAWNHIVCIWDSVAKTIKIYLNGVQATTTITQTGGNGLTNITDISNTARTGQFGAYGVGLNRFNGRMDATAIWAKQLTASEITELYDSGNGKQYPF